MGIFLTYRCIKQTRSQLFLKRQSILYPSFSYYPGGATDPFWEDHEALFFIRFRFRRQHFLQLMDIMDLSGKIFRCYSGKSDDNNRKYHLFPADLCIMVVLRRLSYPCTFQELVDIFGFPSNRIAEMYHTAVDFIYFRYKKLVAFESWVPYFSRFAGLMREYGSPYDGNVGLIDGTFTETCRPGGLRNVNEENQMDQRMSYNGDKAQHGYQTMCAFFPNGMSAMSDPYYGKTHDSKLMRSTGWIPALRAAAAADGLPYCVFGDAAFGLTDVVQVMVKGVYHPDDRSYNAIMSRIRVAIENGFGGQSNQFAFLSFFRSNKMGGRNTPRQFTVASIFMNIRCVFYGNQFTNELGHRLHVSLSELFDLAE